MARRMLVGFAILVAVVVPRSVRAQNVGLSVGYASPLSGLARSSLAGYVVTGDLVWRNPDRLLNWRAGASFTGFGGSLGSTGERTPDAKIYGLDGSLILAPRGNGLMPYVAAGPGLYGYRGATSYRLGWQAAVGLEKPIGRFRLFGEGRLTSFTSERLSDRITEARMRSLSIGIRR